MSDTKLTKKRTDATKTTSIPSRPTHQQATSLTKSSRPVPEPFINLPTREECEEIIDSIEALKRKILHSPELNPKIPKITDSPSPPPSSTEKPTEEGSRSSLPVEASSPDLKESKEFTLADAKKFVLQYPTCPQVNGRVSLPISRLPSDCYAYFRSQGFAIETKQGQFQLHLPKLP